MSSKNSILIKIDDKNTSSINIKNNTEEVIYINNIYYREDLDDNINMKRIGKRLSSNLSMKLDGIICNGCITFGISYVGKDGRKYFQWNNITGLGESRIIFDKSMNENGINDDCLSSEIIKFIQENDTIIKKRDLTIGNKNELIIESNGHEGFTPYFTISNGILQDIQLKQIYLYQSDGYTNNEGILNKDIILSDEKIEFKCDGLSSNYSSTIVIEYRIHNDNIDDKENPIKYVAFQLDSCSYPGVYNIGESIIGEYKTSCKDTINIKDIYSIIKGKTFIKSLVELKKSNEYIQKSKEIQKEIKRNEKVYKVYEQIGSDFLYGLGINYDECDMYPVLFGDVYKFLEDNIDELYEYPFAIDDDKHKVDELWKNKGGELMRESDECINWIYERVIYLQKKKSNK